MNFNYLPIGHIKTYAQKLSKSSMFYLEGWLKKALAYFNVTVADPCCPTDFSPARYNNDTNELENYNQTTDSWESSTIPYLPLAGGDMLGNASIAWENGQYISKGSTDFETYGYGGISLYCSVGYELNWQAGVLTNLQGYNNIQNIKLGSNLQFEPFRYLTDNNNGNISIDVNSRTLYDVNETTQLSWANGLNIPTSIAPISATAAGTAGDMIFTDDYIYRCIATDTWVRTEFLTW